MSAITDKLDQIEARANAATDGPWFVSEDGSVWVDRGDGNADGLTGELAPWATGEADFIAAARDDVPWLIEQIRRRDAALRAALDVHREACNDTALTPPCEHCHGEPGVHPCGCWADEKWQTVCAACTDPRHGFHMDYPCHTVRAIEAAMQEVAP